MKLCPTCDSDKHAECCQRCGGAVAPKRRGTGFCTARCVDAQAREDAASAAEEDALDDEPSEERWVTGDVVDRSGLASYLHLVRAPDDPERSSREARQAKHGKAGAALQWRDLKKASPDSWRARILEHLADGVPRTFNRITVELVDQTADVATTGPADPAIWSLVTDGLVEHTLTTPVYFRLVADATDAPSEPQEGPTP